jgi:hypothetical protein
MQNTHEYESGLLTGALMACLTSYMVSWNSKLFKNSIFGGQIFCVISKVQHWQMKYNTELFTTVCAPTIWHLIGASNLLGNLEAISRH